MRNSKKFSGFWLFMHLGTWLKTACLDELAHKVQYTEQINSRLGEMVGFNRKCGTVAQFQLVASYVH